MAHCPLFCHSGHGQVGGIDVDVDIQINVQVDGEGDGEGDGDGDGDGEGDGDAHDLSCSCFSNLLSLFLFLMHHVCVRVCFLFCAHIVLPHVPLPFLRLSLHPENPPLPLQANVVKN